MRLPEVDPSGMGPTDSIGRTAARCWTLLLARIYECLALQCPRCSEPMRIIALILESPVIERILLHVGEPVAAPEVLPAQAPPQVKIDLPPGNSRPDGWITDDDQDNNFPDISHVHKPKSRRHRKISFRRGMAGKALREIKKADFQKKSIKAKFITVGIIYLIPILMNILATGIFK